MSKMTTTQSLAKPVIIGGLLLAAGIIAATAVRKRGKASDTAESIFESCEGALAKLMERARGVAA